MAEDLFVAKGFILIRMKFCELHRRKVTAECCKRCFYSYMFEQTSVLQSHGRE